MFSMFTADQTQLCRLVCLRLTKFNPCVLSCLKFYASEIATISQEVVDEQIFLVIVVVIVVICVITIIIDFPNCCNLCRCCHNIHRVLFMLPDARELALLEEGQLSIRPATDLFYVRS